MKVWTRTKKLQLGTAFYHINGIVSMRERMSVTIALALPTYLQRVRSSQHVTRGHGMVGHTLMCNYRKCYRESKFLIRHQGCQNKAQQINHHVKSSAETIPKNQEPVLFTCIFDQRIMNRCGSLHEFRSHGSRFLFLRNRLGTSTKFSDSLHPLFHV